MAFIMPSLALDLPPIPAGRLVLRTPQLQHYDAWSSIRRHSRPDLEPFEPLWADSDLTRTGFRERVRRYHREIRAEAGFAFFAFDRDSHALIGGITLSGVRRGVTQSASVGYWVGTPYRRRGHASAMVGAMTGFAFDRLRLHRLEAACMPRNTSSISVLERAGFLREGLARGYLQIAGIWEDHLLFARLATDWNSAGIDEQRAQDATISATRRSHPGAGSAHGGALT